MAFTLSLPEDMRASWYIQVLLISLAVSAVELQLFYFDPLGGALRARLYLPSCLLAPLVQCVTIDSLDLHMSRVWKCLILEMSFWGESEVTFNIGRGHTLNCQNPLLQIHKPHCEALSPSWEIIYSTCHVQRQTLEESRLVPVLLAELKR